MRIMKLRFLLGFLTILVNATLADPCPENLSYSNGQALKRGERYYYNDGRPLLDLPLAYYHSGIHMLEGDDIFYSTGQPLRFRGRLVYPNGMVMLDRGRLRYENGNTMLDGNLAYYADGKVARRNGALYAKDQKLTKGTIAIEEPVGELGAIRLSLEPTREKVEIDLTPMLTSEKGVTPLLLWENWGFSSTEFFIVTGRPQYSVFLRVAGDSVSCDLVHPTSALASAIPRMTARTPRVGLRVR